MLTQYKQLAGLFVWWVAATQRPNCFNVLYDTQIVAGMKLVTAVVIVMMIII